MSVVAFNDFFLKMGIRDFTQMFLQNIEYDKQKLKSVKFIFVDMSIYWIKFLSLKECEYVEVEFCKFIFNRIINQTLNSDINIILIFDNVYSRRLEKFQCCLKRSTEIKKSNDMDILKCLFLAIVDLYNLKIEIVESKFDADRDIYEYIYRILNSSSPQQIDSILLYSIDSDFFILNPNFVSVVDFCLKSNKLIHKNYQLKEKLNIPLWVGVC